jgi:hypothetical protein
VNARFRSGGEIVAVECTPRVGRLIAGAVGAAATTDDPPTVRLRVQPGGGPFPRVGLRPVTRGTWSDGRRTLLVNAGGSGFDLLVIAGEELEVIARYAPGPATYAANLLLRRRFRLLAGQVLVHYPVLWRAGWRGRVPMHVSVLRGPGGAPMLAGPGGVGKSRVVLAALGDGGTVTADNLCVADEKTCFGLAEPLRTDAEGARGRRTSHGRVEVRVAAGAARLDPDRVIVLERGPATEIDDIKPDEAARALIAGTYAAGELRRYWAFAATLALATGRGPTHPLVSEVAHAYTNRLPCRRVRVGDGDLVSLARLCGSAEVADQDGAR